MTLTGTAHAGADAAYERQAAPAIYRFAPAAQRHTSHFFAAATQREGVLCVSAAGRQRATPVRV